ncbi:Mur ligase family protein [Nemorincola caseinilytica]|uniref:Mur ligase family protein n=1 Tax=Nemorincola caseinilytica TaxID=2054315 RepID=A0ABP8NIZ5_9BACT
MQHIHFIAVGGAIMHQLALALHRKGYIVTGSDDEITDPAKSNLAAAELLPAQFGWFPGKITSSVQAVVLGMHAKADNPELLAAKKAGIPVYSFPQYVYEVSKDKKRVVVAGSHGKTTITSMIMHILRLQGMDFDYLVGARVAGFDQSVRLSDAPLIVLEGDEYPASAEERKPKIFFYHPHISVLSGIAWDHINVFPTYDNYFNQFEQYLLGMAEGAKVYYNSEDTEVIRAISTSGGKLAVHPYATPPFHYEDGYPVMETADGNVKVSVFGRHNLLNMRAAIDVCMELGVSEKACFEAIASFMGAARRLEKVKEEPGLLVYRDFAHAPSKLRATLNAVREAYATHHLVACFELHTFSSLNEQFLNEYAGSMDGADDAIVYFSHHALKLKGLPTLDTATVKSYFGREDLIVSDDKEKLEATVRKHISGKDKPVFLLLMSSGTFDGIDWNSVSSHKK